MLKVIKFTYIVIHNCFLITVRALTKLNEVLGRHAKLIEASLPRFVKAVQQSGRDASTSSA